MKKQEEFEEFEEFDDEDEDEEDEGEPIPEVEEVEEVEEVKPVVVVKKKKKVLVKPEVKPVEKETEVEEPPVQYVGVPRAVSVEEMINRVFDELQELKQMVSTLLPQSK